MGNLQVIEIRGQRVLTTKQLAEAYGTETDVLKHNFGRNKKHYKENKHYIALIGEELRAFKRSLEIHDQFKNKRVIKNPPVEKSFIAIPQNEEQKDNWVINYPLVGKRTACLYLWTEKGALFHAKSINTDRAWEVYDYLVDFYFRAREQPRQQAPAVKEAAKPLPAPQEKGRLVVDVPVNRKIQEKLAEARRYTTAIDVLLTECDCYNEPQHYEAIKQTLFMLSGELARVAIRLVQTAPNQIRKE